MDFFEEISVIIPTLNEDRLVGNAIQSAIDAGAPEIIVADGGSDDATLDVAANLGCKIVRSEPGRGTQLNAGTDISSNDVILFLHADSQIPVDGCQQIRQAIEHGHFAGAFKQKIDRDGMAYRWIESGNAFRVRWLQMAYGDQGIFVTRELFEELGGFEDIPFMEDFCFSRKLRQSHRFCLLDGPLLVDGRHWKKRGPLKQTFNNWRTITRFLLGAKPGSLASVNARAAKQVEPSPNHVNEKIVDSSR